jgi:hypothetical protein
MMVDDTVGKAFRERWQVRAQCRWAAAMIATLRTGRNRKMEER